MIVEFLVPRSGEKASAEVVLVAAVVVIVVVIAVACRPLPSTTRPSASLLPKGRR